MLADLIKSVSDVVTGGRRRGGAPSREAGRSGGRRPTSTPRPSSSSSAATAPGHPPRADAEVSPGEVGPDATVEVDPHRIGSVRVAIGAGGWDGEGRPSWVNLDRVIRVREGGMRREESSRCQNILS
jgi:hypothetical protein